VRLNLRIATLLFVLVAVLARPALSQTAPCGRSFLREGGEKEENRFIAAPLDHVKASLVKALPSVYGRLTKDEGTHVEAVIDGDLEMAQQKGFGSQGMKRGSTGTFHIDFEPETEGGVTGTVVHIRFSKGIVASLGSGRYATPLADETACLVTLLSADDPVATPSGVSLASAQSTSRAVTLKADTPVRVALANYFYTKDVPKNNSDVKVTLEVVEDVVVESVVVIRKGALVKGEVSGLSKSKSFGRDASFRFVVDAATAVDGQEVALSNTAVVRKGTPGWQVATGVAFNGLAFGLVKGQESLVRAGTGWELPTAADITITVPR